MVSGAVYALGRGWRRTTEAVAWYRKAAEQGLPDAQCYLGIMYGAGRGVPQDYGQAVFWFQKAAAQGLAEGKTTSGWRIG